MALWKEKRSKKWRYEFQINGTRYTASGFATKTEAKGTMEKHRKQVKNGKQTQAAMGFKELASIYLLSAPSTPFNDCYPITATIGKQAKEKRMTGYSRSYKHLPVGKRLTAERIFKEYRKKYMAHIITLSDLLCTETNPKFLQLCSEDCLGLAKEALQHIEDMPTGEELIDIQE